MIIEGIITTEDADGGMHLAPIGPHVDPELTDWVLKPFQSSTTFANLYRTSRGVFHIVDDALLMAQAVLGRCRGSDAPPASLTKDLGWQLQDCCRSIALVVTRWELEHSRATAHCSVVAHATHRPFWGWNRAKHSIVELSIVASRVHILPREEIERELARHKVIIEKTAGPRELMAWELLQEYLTQ